MKICRKKPLTFITVHIGGKAYDYPKHLPFPKSGDKVMMDKQGYATVTHVCHNVMFDEKGRNVLNDIVIHTIIE